jgi:peptidoglycan/xylan/chitin deacetylase (PgdA/CDA1 family)
MRKVEQFGVAIACGVAAFIAALAPSFAEEACPDGALGVSRTIEVDTTGGPWFGEPHGNRDFLSPGEVVLTFDDGPSARDTRPILAALAAECTKATFFVVGEMIAVHPEIVAETVAQGHTIGVHTWTHPNLAHLSKERAIQQIEATFNAAQNASPQPIAPFFRYPYLSSNKAIVEYLQSRNIGQFAIDIDSLDWRTHSAKAVVNRVMAGLKRRGRGIILMHDIHKSTVAALPELLKQIKAKGYKVVHLKAKSGVNLIADVTPPAKKVRAATGKSSRKSRRQRTASSRKKAAQQTQTDFSFGSW